MISKYKEVRERLKKHIEDANGEGSWKEYYGSQLEADFIYFVEREVKNNVDLALVSNSDCKHRFHHVEEMAVVVCADCKEILGKQSDC